MGDPRFTRTPAQRMGLDKNPLHPNHEFDPSMLERAYRLALLGLVNTDIAGAFGVRWETFETWCGKFPQLREVLQKGRQEADSAVAYSLFQSAIGYDYHEDAVLNSGRFSRVVKVQKRKTASVTAAIFWLKNRTRNLPEPWRDQHHHEVGVVDRRRPVDLSDFTEAELAIIYAAGLKLAGGDEDSDTPPLLGHMAGEEEDADQD